MNCKKLLEMLKIAKKVKRKKCCKMMENIQKLAEKYNVVEASKELRNLQTKKCRLLKQKSRKDYDVKLTKILQEEQLMKELVKYYNPEKVKVTKFLQKDIDLLNYDETVKAIKSIQSKKCNSQFLLDLTDFNKALEIEQMLLNHKKQILPIAANVVKKTEINNLVNEIENLANIDKDYILDQLKKFL